jgi:formate/nitrite transporter FocA (FNT family)
MLDLSREATGHAWLATAFRGITSGFLMAALVWLIPASESAQFHVIVAMTYLIGVSGSAHIVAGSVSAFLLLASGEAGLAAILAHFLLPVLLGNIIGGTVLFAMLSYAQVMKEI